MKPFLILGHPMDLHASYVAWALGSAGYDTAFVNSSHDSCPARATLYIDDDRDDFTTPEWRDAEAAWCRRLFWNPGLDEATHDEFTSLEERRFTKWLFEVLEKCPIRCINPPTAGQVAENKFIQLKVAKSHGIPIPRTLVTAQPNRFRAFLRREGTLVAKPLDAYCWESESGEKSLAFASEVDIERGSRFSDDDISQCVTMYQERIEKTADVRVVIMGADVFAYKVIQEGGQHFDFRVGFYKENHLRYEAIPFPLALKKKLNEFMDSLRINFASADFALRLDGEWVFLDLNPSGQWLFLEEACPDSFLGQKFCSFFVHGNIASSTIMEFPSFAQYMNSDAARSLQEAIRQIRVARSAPANLPAKGLVKDRDDSVIGSSACC